MRSYTPGCAVRASTLRRYSQCASLSGPALSTVCTPGEWLTCCGLKFSGCNALQHAYHGHEHHHRLAATLDGALDGVLHQQGIHALYAHTKVYKWWTAPARHPHPVRAHKGVQMVYCACKASTPCMRTQRCTKVYKWCTAPARHPRPVRAHKGVQRCTNGVLRLQGIHTLYAHTKGYTGVQMMYCACKASTPCTRTQRGTKVCKWYTAPARHPHPVRAHKGVQRCANGVLRLQGIHALYANTKVCKWYTAPARHPHPACSEFRHAGETGVGRKTCSLETGMFTHAQNCIHCRADR
eukprot:1157037-Pelagomonas_calceolata.AAC.2